jgi:hypothetical protein
LPLRYEIKAVVTELKATELFLLLVIKAKNAPLKKINNKLKVALLNAE